MSPPNVSRQPVEPVRQDIVLRVEAEMTRLLYRSAGFGLYSNFVLAMVLGVVVAALVDADESVSGAVAHRVVRSNVASCEGHRL